MYLLQGLFGPLGEKINMEQHLLKENNPDCM